MNRFYGLFAFVFMICGCSDFSFTYGDESGKAPLDKEPQIGSYQAVPYRDGIARLDTRSGNVMLVTSEGVRNLEGDDQVFGEPSQRDHLSVPIRVHGKFPYSTGGFWYDLTYKWVDDNLLFRYQVGPYVGSVNDARIGKNGEMAGSIQLNFNDADGFELLEASVRVIELIPTLGEDGPSFWQHQGKVACTADLYAQLKYVNPSWAFSDSFEAAIVEAEETAQELVQSRFGTLQAHVDAGRLADSGVSAARLDSGEFLVSRVDTNGWSRSVGYFEWDELIREAELNALFSKPTPTNAVPSEEVLTSPDPEGDKDFTSPDETQTNGDAVEQGSS